MVCVQTRQVVCVFVGRGREHDKTLLERSRHLPHDAAALLLDLAYVGIAKKRTHSFVPFRKSSLPGLAKEKRKLSKAERRVNAALAKIRIVIEWVFRRVKVFKILGTKYRNRRKRFGLRLNLITAIYNYEYALKDAKPLLKEV